MPTVTKIKIVQLNSVWEERGRWRGTPAQGQSNLRVAFEAG